jgi:aminoglycoside phosphotransferase (APT) family kinase protein
VLRRYREGWDVAGEAAVMGHVAAYGFPVPVVHSAAGADLVMERLDGPTMLAAIAVGAVGIEECARTLADLHVRLHALPTRGGSGDGAHRVLHLDLHPDNVMLTSRGPVVIDWRNAAEGPPDLDVAMSALIMAEVAVDPASPFADVAAEGVRSFLGAVGGSPGRWIERAVAMRAANPTLSPGEKARLGHAAGLVAGGGS